MSIPLLETFVGLFLASASLLVGLVGSCQMWNFDGRTYCDVVELT